MEEAPRVMRWAAMLAVCALAACAPAQPTADVSLDAGGLGAGVGVRSGPVRAGVGTDGASAGVSAGAVQADVDTGGVAVSSGPLRAGMGEGGPSASVDVLENESARLKLGVGGGGPSASLRFGDLPVGIKLSPRGLGLAL